MAETTQPLFFCQANIFEPILAHQGGTQLKRWVLLILCLSSRAVHLEILHHYSPESITRGFQRRTPRIIWIDSRINIVRVGKDLIDTDMKVISSLNLKVTTIEFRVTLPKHHASIGAVQWRESSDPSRTQSASPSLALTRSRWMTRNS